MPLDFTAIDFETANRSPASACAVGVVRVRDGEICDEASWLIRPPAGHDTFEPFNVQLHGVSAEVVSTAPSWEEQRETLLDFIGDDVIVAHNAPFDIGVMVAAHRATGTIMPPVRYFCSLRLARASYRLPSYRLPSAAAAAGYILTRHHDPLDDARAAAAIVVDIARTARALTLADLGATRIKQVPDTAGSERDAALNRLIADATF